MKFIRQFCGTAAFLAALPALGQTSHHIDIMFDTSGSLRSGRPAVVAAVQTLAWSLLLESQNAQRGSVTLGLNGFCQDVERIAVNDDEVFDVEQWPAAAKQLRHLGSKCQGREDGWLALAKVLEQRPAQQPGHLLLITDEDRDNVDQEIDQATLLNTLYQRNLVLDVVAPVRLQCADGRSALGMTSKGIGYVATKTGTFEMCTGAAIESAMGTTVADYVTLATASGGSVWDVMVLARRGHSREALQPVIEAMAQSYTSAVLNRNRWASSALSFMARPVTPTMRVMYGEAVEMSGTSSVASRDDLSIYEWQWDINGDGSPDYYGPHAFHVFTTPGYRAVTLTVLDSEGKRDDSVMWLDVYEPFSQ